MEDLIKLLDAKSIMICSFVSWGIVQAVKPIVKAKLSDSITSAVLRSLAIVAGASIGFSLDSSAHGAGLGAACGAMSAFTVALMKRVISSTADVDMEGIDSGSSDEDSKEGS